MHVHSDKTSPYCWTNNHFVCFYANKMVSLAHSYTIGPFQVNSMGVYIWWNGMVEWNSGMDYWNGGMLHRTYLIIQHVLYSEQ